MVDTHYIVQDRDETVVSEIQTEQSSVDAYGSAKHSVLK